jgi:hypothetical protein
MLSIIKCSSPQKLAGGNSVIVVMCRWYCSKVKVSRGIKPSPPNVLEPVPLTLAAQYLHVS